MSETSPPQTRRVPSLGIAMQPNPRGQARSRHGMVGIVCQVKQSRSSTFHCILPVHRWNARVNNHGDRKPIAFLCVKKRALSARRWCHRRHTSLHISWASTGSRRRQLSAASSGRPGMRGVSHEQLSKSADGVGGGNAEAVASRNLGVSFICESPSFWTGDW